MIKKIKVLLTILIMFLGTITAVSEQVSKEEKISVEKVIKKYLDAIGGEEKIKKVKSITTFYNVFMQTRKGYLRKKEIHRKGTLKSQRVGGNISTYFDGKKLWIIQGEKKKELTGKVVNNFQKEVDLDGPFIDYRKKGIKIKYIGKEKIEFSQFIKLEVTWKDNEKKTYYFDSISGFLKMKRESTVLIINGKTSPGPDAIDYYYDYREINGIKYPFYWIQTDEKLKHMHMFTVDKIKIE